MILHEVFVKVTRKARVKKEGKPQKPRRCGCDRGLSRRLKSIQLGSTKGQRGLVWAITAREPMENATWRLWTRVQEESVAVAVLEGAARWAPATPKCIISVAQRSPPKPETRGGEPATQTPACQQLPRTGRLGWWCFVSPCHFTLVCFTSG